MAAEVQFAASKQNGGGSGAVQDCQNRSHSSLKEMFLTNGVSWPAKNQNLLVGGK